jgi:hypothetical protein
MKEQTRPKGRTAELCLALAALVASSTALAITHTGNPGTAVVITTQHTAWTIQEIDSASASMSLQACSDGQWHTVSTASTTAPTAASFDAPPAGTWCAIEIELVDLDVLAEDSTSREVKLVDLDVTFTLPFLVPTTVDAQSPPTWNVELGIGWLDYATTYLDPGEHRTVQMPGAAADAVIEALASAAVYVDVDADAVTSTAENTAGAIAK